MSIFQFVRLSINSSDTLNDLRNLSLSLSLQNVGRFMLKKFETSFKLAARPKNQTHEAAFFSLGSPNARKSSTKFSSGLAIKTGRGGFAGDFQPDRWNFAFHRARSLSIARWSSVRRDFDLRIGKFRAGNLSAKIQDDDRSGEIIYR